MKLIPIILVLSVILVNFQVESFTKGLITKVRNKLKNTVEAKKSDPQNFQKNQVSLVKNWQCQWLDTSAIAFQWALGAGI